MAKQKKILTPRGTAIWPHLNTPDTKFVKEGEYRAKIAVEADDKNLPGFIEELTRLRDECFQEHYDKLVADKKVARAKELKKADIGTPEVDEETGDETGRILFTAKQKAVIKTSKGETFKPKLAFCNAKLVDLKNPPKIGGGSVLRLGVEPSAFLNETTKTVGVSLRLKSVQLIKLVSGGTRSAASDGFEAEDDGDDIYDAEDAFESDDSDIDGGSVATDEDDDL